MAASSSGALKDLVHPSLNETLKTQNSVTFKLVKTGKRLNELFLHDIEHDASNGFRWDDVDVVKNISRCNCRLGAGKVG